MEVVVDQVVHHVAAQAPDEEAQTHPLREDLGKKQVETPNNGGGQPGGEDQSRAVKRGLREQRETKVPSLKAQ